MLPRLIVLSAEHDIENEVSIVNELFRQGMDLFHLRKPKWSIDEQRAFLEKIADGFLKNISVHQHRETIQEFDLKYFHLKEKERKFNLNLFNDQLLCSSSYHYYNSLKNESHRWDYCFLSPLYDSISKAGYSAAIPSDLKIEKDLDVKVFALGGIREDNIESVFNRGFYGAAVCGALWKDPGGILEKFNILNEKCSKNVHMY